MFCIILYKINKKFMKYMELSYAPVYMEHSDNACSTVRVSDLPASFDGDNQPNLIQIVRRLIENH